MTYVFIGLAVLIVIASVIAFVFNRLYRKYKTAYKQEHNKLKGLEQEYLTLVEAYKIKKKNKEKADEKVDDLYNGDSVVNAINILRK